MRSALVGVGLAAADAMSSILVLGHSNFYSRFGFMPSKNYWIEPPFPVPVKAFMIKPLKNYRQHYRGKVVLPPTFRDV